MNILKFKKESGNVVGKNKNFLPTASNEQNSENKPDYKKMFVHKTGLMSREGKQVSVRNEYHERMWNILGVIGQNEVTMIEYLDNVIADHFKTFDKAIKESYNKHLKSYHLSGFYNAGNGMAIASEECDNLQKSYYEKTFVCKTDVTARTGKQVSVRKEYHERIRRILQVIGKSKVTIADYLDNVITDHYKTHDEAIEKSYNKNFKSFYI